MRERAIKLVIVVNPRGDPPIRSFSFSFDWLARAKKSFQLHRGGEAAKKESGRVSNPD